MSSEPIVTPQSINAIPVRPFLTLGIGVLAGSTAAILIVRALQEANPLVVAAYRLGLATLLLAPIAMGRLRAEWPRLEPRDLGWIAASGIFLGLHFATWVASLALTSVASSVVLVTINPLFVALFSAVLLGERLPRPASLGMVAALLGAVVIGLGDVCSAQGTLLGPALRPLFGLLHCAPASTQAHAGSELLGDGLALTGAVMVAAYFLIGRRLRGRISLLAYIFAVYGIAAIILIIAVLAGGYPAVGFSPIAYGCFILLAVIPQLIGHSSYNLALRYLPASTVATGALGEPIGSTTLAFLLLGQKPTLLTVLGGILLLIGIYVALHFGQQPITDGNESPAGMIDS